jgi:acyl phosphate:glycerol-3-phosphate acyltransferase
MKVLFAVLAYFFGALPTGYLAFRLGGRGDIREHGSRATGATNVMRLRGWKLALPVALADILKGFLPAFLAVRLFHDPGLALVASFLAIFGHCFPVYIRFRGGKGVATTVGAAAVIGPVPLLISAGLFAVVVGLTRYVSLGSMLAITAFPFLALVLGAGAKAAVWGAAVAALVIFRHRGNIDRLLSGRERKLGEKAE